MRPSDRRSRLRSATSHAHSGLDERVAEAGFFDVRSSYERYLVATLRAREPAERALSEYGAARLFAWWPTRTISFALQSDIDDLSPECPAFFADVQDPITIETDAQALGVLYVLEGSALGARVLARRAEELGMTSTFGARHLARQTAIPQAWPTFLAVLEASPLGGLQEAECVRAAIATFIRFEDAYR